MSSNFSQMTIKEIGKSILGWFGFFVAIGLVICGIVYGILSMTKENYSYQIFRSKAELAYYSTKDELVKEIDEYIQSFAPNSALNGFAIVEACEEYKIDVRFVLAQGQVESAFGTKGIAAKTNSVFNVLAYDGRSAKDMVKKGHGYHHPDQSIRPYLELLANDYLIDKNEMDLMKNFVNKEGKRYASSNSYEQSIRCAFATITENTNISNLWSEYMKYKIIANK